MTTTPSFLYSMTYSHVRYILQDSGGGHLILKVSKQGNKLLLSKTEFVYALSEQWTPFSFRSFLITLVDRGQLPKEDAPPMLSPELVEEIKKIEETEGDLNTAIRTLADNLEDTEKAKLLELEDALQQEWEIYQQALNAQSEDQSSFQLLSDEFNGLLDQSYEAFKYLTYGWGQFEEYEIDWVEERKELESCFGELDSDLLALADKLKNVKNLHHRAKGAEALKTAKIVLKEFRKKTEELIGKKASKYKETLKTLDVLSSEKQDLIRLFRAIECYCAPAYLEYSSMQVNALIDNKRKTRPPMPRWAEAEFHHVPSVKSRRNFLQKNNLNLIEEENPSQQNLAGQDFPDIEIGLTYFEEPLDRLRNFAEFDRQLAQREIYRVLGGRKIAEKFSKKKDNCKRYLEELSESFRKLELDRLDNCRIRTAQVFEPLRKEIDTISNCLQQKRDSFCCLRYDEWTSNEKVLDEVFSDEIAHLASLAAILNKVEKTVAQLHLKLQDYLENKENLEAKNALYIQSHGDSYFKAYNDLMDFLKNKMRNPQSAPAFLKKTINKPESQHLEEKQQQHINQVIALHRKGMLQKNEPNNDKTGLIKKRAELQKQIDEATVKLDPIEVAIEWTRIDRRIIELEEKLEKAKIDIARKFEGHINTNTFDSTHLHAFAKIGLSTYAARVQSVSFSPFHSPLAHLISTTSQSGIKKGEYEGFAVSFNRQLSFFEQGIFKILGKASEQIVTTSFCDDVFAGIDSTNPNFTDFAFPEYYKKFVWTSPNNLAFQTENALHDKPIFEIYTLLSIHIAHLFQKEGKRKSRDIPDGNPIACLIVSEKGEILSWGLNTLNDETKDMIRHAEVNALGAYFRRHPEQSYLPSGTLLFTSLKSCHMCAGLICDSGDPENSIKVKYGQTDPSQNKTCLEGQEEKMDLELVKAIDFAYEQLKSEKSTINAASSLNEQEFEPILNQISDTLNAFLSTDTAPCHIQKEISDFLTFCQEN